MKMWKKLMGKVDEDVENTPDAPVLEEEVSVEKKPDHKHEWNFITKTYGAPRRDVSSQNENILQRSLFGVTTFMWECVVCKEIRKEEVLGSEGNQLEDFLNKADTIGPQYIQREGVTYIIARYNQQQSPSVPSGYVPLK